MFPRRLVGNHRRFSYGLFTAEEGGELVVRAEDSTPERALEKLLKLNYDRVRHLVFKRAGWKCEHCKRIAPLQCHHVQFRSHGRVDSLENCVALCSGCHGSIHKEGVMSNNGH